MRGTTTHIPNCDLMARLMQPLADVDLSDPDLSRLEARARREATGRLMDAWMRAWTRYRRANDRFDLIAALRLARLDGCTEFTAVSDDDLDAARARWLASAARLIRTPAPRAWCVQLKLRLRSLADNPAEAAEWDGLIAADVARLGMKPPKALNHRKEE